jgi:hypothetical protein
MTYPHVRFSKMQPTTRFEGSRKGEADLLLKCVEEEPRKACGIYHVEPY